MAETKDGQKPGDIRVIDRRLFTAEGELRRDLPPEEAAAPPPPLSPPPRAEARGGRRVAAAPAPAVVAGPAPSAREEEVAGAHFKNLVLNLATTAAANLGEIPNPFSRATEVDLEGARQVIDLLASLQVKTRGNLSAEEGELVESLLYDLKTKYVSLQKKATKTS